MLINSPNISGSLTVTGNIVATGSLTVSGTISGTVAGTTATASYVEYTNVANKPTLVSGSSQVTYSGLTGIPSGIVSGSSQVIYSGLSSIPSGIVSGSAQVAALGYATTSSNIFQANQIITGSLFISQNLVVAGSSSIQYISSSVVDIADNIITVNAFNPGVRFGGLAVIDSGSSPRVSGSMLFDSIKDQWIFVHENPSALTSSVVLMGPETYNDLGNEIYLSANRLPKGSGIEHLRDSNITDTGTVVSVNSNTSVTGSFAVITGSAVELQVTNTGVNLGSALTDSHIISGSLRVNPNGLFVSGSGNVGVGTTNPTWKLQVETTDVTAGMFRSNAASTILGIDNSAADGDPQLKFYINDIGTFTLGVDDSDGDKFKIGTSDLTTNTRLTINSSGHVGIGTDSPQSGLHVSGTGGNAWIKVERTDTNSNIVEYVESGARLGYVGYISNNLWVNNGILSDTLFLTNNLERLRITSGGEILLATTLTGASGLSINNSRNISFAEGSDQSYANIFRQRNTAATVIASGYKRSLTAEVASSFSSAMARAAIAVGYNNGSIAFFTNPSSTVANGTDMTPTERVTILNSGNVGIGTTSPSTLLDIRGTGEGIYVARMATNDNGSHVRMQKARGSITSPTIVSNGDTIGNLTFEAYNGSSYSEATGIRGIVNGTVSAGSTPTDLFFSAGASGTTAANEHMRITSAGNIGINTASPTTYSLAGSHVENFGGSNYAFIHNNTTTVKSFLASNESALLAALFTFSAHPLTFGTSNIQRMRITSGGDLIKATHSGVDGTYDSIIRYMANGDIGVNNNRWIGMDATITAGGPSANVLRFRVYQGNAAQDQPPLTAMTLNGLGDAGIAGSLILGTAEASNTDIRINNATNLKTHYVFSDASSGELGIESGVGVGIKFNTNSSNTRMVITSAGKVIINDTSTDSLFGINTKSSTAYNPNNYNGNTASIRLTNGSAGSGRYTGIAFGGGGATEGFFGVVQNSSNLAEFVWQTYNGAAYGERMRMTSSGDITVNGGTISNSGNYKANTFIQLTSVATKTFSVSGPTQGNFAVTDFSGVPSNAKALLVYGWYHITGYSIGSGQGDHAVSWFGLANNISPYSWSGPGNPWPGDNSSFTPAYYGSFAMDHDGDSSVGSSNINYYGTWHNGIINVNANGTVYHTLAHGYSGGTHHIALYCVGYWV